MQFIPQQQNQFEPEQQYWYGQPPLSSSPLQTDAHQQPLEGIWQPMPQQWQQPHEGTWQPMPQQSYPLQYPSQQWQRQSLQGNPGQPVYAPQIQQPMYSYSPVQPIMIVPQQIVNVNIQKHQHSLFVRALYFLFIGWWAGLAWLNIGYFFVLTVIGLPIGLVMLNRLPTVLTLKPANQSININIVRSTTNINISGTQQANFLLRALYFVFIGWWAGLVWSWSAYVMFVFIATIPVGVIMLNLLPTIITLRKN